MSEALDTITENAPTIAKELGTALVQSAAETAAALVGAVLVLTAAGAVLQMRDKRKAKKTTLTVVPSE